MTKAEGRYSYKCLVFRTSTGSLVETVYTKADSMTEAEAYARKGYFISRSEYRVEVQGRA